MTFKELQAELKVILQEEMPKEERSAKIKETIKRFAADPETSLEDLRKVTQLIP